MSLAGIYVHIPFCSSKCPYCDFYSVVSDGKLHDIYIKAVVNDIITTKKYKDADTLYFGGGTPILINDNYIKSIIDICKQKFNLNYNCEITLEANPCITTKQKLYNLYKAGVNRLSFGMQSSNDEELFVLGRKHKNKDVKNSVKWAKEVGFKNISVDIMLGTPKQTIESVKNTLDFLLSLDIQHISAYMLKVEKGTKFDCDYIKSMIADEDLVSDIYLFVCEYLEKNGFIQYEISNFSKKGYESKHNLKYWQYDDYYGFGASAHGFINNERYSYPRDINQYINTNGKNKTIDDYIKNNIEEYLMLNLRLTKGINLNDFQQKYNVNVEKIKNTSKKFIDFGLMKESENILYLTPKGFLLSNYIISHLMLCI